MDRFARRTQESSSNPQGHGLPRNQGQQKLPPFRDIIPAHLHNEIDSKSHGTQSGHQSPATTSPKLQYLQSQPSAMHPLAQVFEESSGQQLDFGRPPPNTSQRQSETSLRHNASMQYSDRSNPYHAPNPLVNHSQLYSQNMNNRSPNLPSLRHMGSDRSSNGMETSHGIPFPYNDSYGCNYGNSYEPEPSHYLSTRTPVYDQVQRTHQSYGDSNGTSGMFPPPQVRHLPTYDSSRGYLTIPSGYVDADYSPTSPHPLTGAPYSNFGVIGDGGDSRNKKRRGNLPKPVTDILRAWFHEHLHHPYPSEDDKQMLIARTGLTISQISNWFINARRRYLPALKNNGRSHDDERGSGRHHSESDRVSSKRPSLSPG